MTNEMKLLMAMCDAMGFEVEVHGRGFNMTSYKVTKKHPYINLEAEKIVHDAMQIKLKSQIDETLSGRKASTSPNESRLQRKNNVMVSLAAELQAGAITQAEYFRRQMKTFNAAQLSQINAEGVTSSILSAVEHEFQMSGLSSGLYAEYAGTVAGRVFFAVMCSLKNYHNLTDKQISDIQDEIQKAGGYE